MSCASRQELPPQDLGLGQRLAARPCDDDGARVELVDIRPDPVPHKPSVDVERYLVDLRARSHAEAWLIINQETAPSGVDGVSKERHGPGWWLGVLHAHLIPRGGDVTVKDVSVGVGRDGKLPALLARISVEEMTPQRWVQVENGGQGDHRSTFGGKLVPLAIDVECVSWFDVRASGGTAAP